MGGPTAATSTVLRGSRRGVTVTTVGSTGAVGHGAASSSDAANRSRRPSSPRRPTSCAPSGSPFASVPAGTLIAGWPVVLKMPVNALKAEARTIVSGRVVSTHPSSGIADGQRRREEQVVIGEERCDLPTRPFECVQRLDHLEPGHGAAPLVEDPRERLDVVVLQRAPQCGQAAPDRVGDVDRHHRRERAVRRLDVVRERRLRDLVAQLRAHGRDPGDRVGAVVVRLVAPRRRRGEPDPQPPRVDADLGQERPRAPTARVRVAGRRCRRPRRGARRCRARCA